MMGLSRAWLSEQVRALTEAVTAAANTVLSNVLNALGSTDWMQLAIWIGVVAILLVPGATCVWIARRVGRIRDVSTGQLEQVEHRITKLSAALSLLTDTTEAAFRDVMQEVERQTQARNGSPFDRRVSAERRMGLAASNGRTAREIALSEGISEGEVRLRLRLAQHLEAVTARSAVGE